MRIALFVTCLADGAVPRRRPGHGAAAGAARATRSSSPTGRPVAGRCTRTPATSARRCRWCAITSRPSSRTTWWLRPRVHASARCATSTRWSPAAPATRHWPTRAAAVAATHLRAVRAARRRPRGRGRRCALPAPGHLPPHLPLVADAAGRGQAAATAARGPRHRPGRAARRRPVLRFRRHLLGEERGHLDSDARRQDASRPRHRSRGRLGRRLVVPDAHRRRPVAAAFRHANRCTWPRSWPPPRTSRR